MHSSASPEPIQSPVLRRASERGITLVEIAIALVVIAIATLGSVSWTLSGMSLDTENHAYADANEVMRGVLEELQGVPYDELFTRFNANPDDDPDGPGTARGAEFVIETTCRGDFLLTDAQRLLRGLVVPKIVGVSSMVAYRKNRLGVMFEFPVDLDGHLSELAEGAEGSDLIWDLDGSGQLEAGDRASSHRVLPMRIRVYWESPQGSRYIEHVRLFSRRVRAGGGG